MRRVFIARGVALALLLVAFGIYAAHTAWPPTKIMTNTTATVVQVGAAAVAVELADTHEERVQGLSGRETLAEGTGLLFDFYSPGNWGIWMKDMRFSIDIVWANEGRVVSVAHGVAPETYPQSFYPAAPARYVLELPAGYAGRHGIAEGAEFVVQ